MIDPLQIVQNDRLPILEFTIEKGGVAFNLTGYTVVFSMLNNAGVRKIDKQACVVVSAAAGTVQYSWQEGETDTAGDFTGEVQVTDSNGRTQTTFDPIPIVIREQIA